jgi:hypothetical protein
LSLSLYESKDATPITSVLDETPKYKRRIVNHTALTVTPVMEKKMSLQSSKLLTYGKHQPLVEETLNILT